jgi:probable HAF family extracellular repeat protein
MEKLGLVSGSVIYYDIENYDPTATCKGNPTGSYVNSFLAGWVSEIHANGYIAGVYGNTAPASTWYAGGTGYSAVSPSPDDVWIANYNNANSNVTIWGLNSTAGSLPDTAWPQDQRMHQYQGPNSPTWGGLQLNIDNDIEDADVTGGNGTKSYTYSYTTIDFPGAYSTGAYGINNSGQIVGQYFDLHLMTTRSFLDTAGSFTTIDFPGARQTQASGINNAGSIVGEYVDQGGVFHGFLYQAGSYTSLDYPNATLTQANGINDDNQISGIYRDAASNPHGFQYQAGTFISIDCSGCAFDGANGINGDAQIGGGTNTSEGFLYACWPFPNCANGGTFTYYPFLAGVLSVNNNEQMAASSGGSIVFYHEGIADTIAVPGAAAATTLVSTNDFTMQNSQGAAKVALVGYYHLSGQQSHGFLATSQ